MATLPEHSRQTKELYMLMTEVCDMWTICQLNKVTNENDSDQDCGWSLLVECLSNMCKALELIPALQNILFIFLYQIYNSEKIQIYLELFTRS